MSNHVQPALQRFNRRFTSRYALVGDAKCADDPADIARRACAMDDQLRLRVMHDLLLGRDLWKQRSEGHLSTDVGVERWGHHDLQLSSSIGVNVGGTMPHLVHLVVVAFRSPQRRSMCFLSVGPWPKLRRACVDAAPPCVSTSIDGKSAAWQKCCRSNRLASTDSVMLCFYTLTRVRALPPRVNCWPGPLKRADALSGCSDPWPRGVMCSIVSFLYEAMHPLIARPRSSLAQFLAPDLAWMRDMGN